MLDNNASLKELIDAFELVDNDLVDRGLAQTITPSTSNKVLAKGNYRGDITVKGDADLVDKNIKSGVSLFGINGTLNEFKNASGYFSFNNTLNSTDKLFATIPLNLTFTPKNFILETRLTWVDEYSRVVYLSLSIVSKFNYSLDNSMTFTVPGSTNTVQLYLKNVTSTSAELWGKVAGSYWQNFDRNVNCKWEAY